MDSLIKIKKTDIDQLIKIYNQLPMPLQVVFALIIGLILYQLLSFIIFILVLGGLGYVIFYFIEVMDNILECQTTITNINKPGLLTTNYEVDTSHGRFYFSPKDKILYEKIKPYVRNGSVTIHYALQDSMRVLISVKK